MKVEHLKLSFTKEDFCMKKTSIFISIILCFSLLITVTSCNSGLADSLEITETQETTGAGSATLKIVMPDYYAMASLAKNQARTIAPQTAKIRLSYKKSSNWINHEIINLSDATKTAIPNTPEGFAGSAYTCTFQSIPSGNYSAGNMKIELLDADGVTISAGTNDEAVKITMGKTAQAAFYTIPVSVNAYTGSLQAGEMKFLKKDFNSEYGEKLTITVPAGSSYPDLVIFDAKGTFEKYISVSSTNNTIDCSEYQDSTKYLGFWSAAATSYNTSFTVIIPPTDLETVFDSILSSTEWTKTNSSAITESNGVYTFDGKKQTGGFKRTIILSEPKTISFKVKTVLYQQYDGSLDFLIDNTVMASFTGTNGSWENAIFDIDAGEHTIEWKRNDTSTSSTNNITPEASVKDFAFGQALQPLEEINQTFETAVDSNMWIGKGTFANVINADPLFAAWAQYGDALVDTHQKVFKLGTYENNTHADSSLTIKKIRVTQESALSFDYKCDLYNDDTYNCCIQVFIDNDTTPVLEMNGSKQTWQKGSVILSAGTHSVTFSTKSTVYSPNLTNSVYLDNITLAPNTVASVDIYPKGVQETYVGGDTIKFTAKALRSDGSIIDGKAVTWTASAGTISSSGVFTPGSSSSTVTVTATIEGKTASNNTVTVHGTNYLTDSVTINGKTFTGTITNGSGSRSNTTNITWANPTPNYKSFTTDGFFVLKGTANNTYGYVKVTKGDYQTSYYLPQGDFEQRIWLRFGDGQYTVFVTEIELTYASSYDGYEGDLLGMNSYYTSGPSTTTFTVTNNSGLSPTYSAGECALLMPSYLCQSDDFIVSNAFNAIMAELPESATLGQKLQAIHDWEIHRNHYDNVSFNDDNKRKKQDAVSVIKYEMAVCEGYANLFAALARHLGVQTAYQSSTSMGHGWVECYYNSSWFLLDATWDDPVSDNTNNNTEKNPTSENYKYFLIETSGVNGDHSGNSTEYGRSIIAKPVSQIPHMKNYPNGWY